METISEILSKTFLSGIVAILLIALIASLFFGGTMENIIMNFSNSIC